MAATDVNDVLTPSVIIYYEDGLLLKQDILDAKKTESTLQVSITYSLPNPDGRVEYDLWTTSSDPAAAPFKHSFGAIAQLLGDAALFTPYMFTIVDNSCRPRAGLLACGNQCSNSGRYCAIDPNKDTTSGLSGRDVVQENVRQKCLWNVTQTLQLPQSKWFDYVTGFDSTCGNACSPLPKDANVNPDCPNGWSATCSFKVMDQILGSHVSSLVQKCVTDSGGYDALTNSTNSILEAEISATNEYGIIMLPTLFVNKQSFKGSLNCPNPSTCGPFNAICAGYKVGTTPPVCETSPGCDAGLSRDVCGVCESLTSGHFNESCKGCDGVPKSGKVNDACGVCDGPGTRLGGCLSAGSIAAIFIIAILLATAAIAGVWWYLRRQTRTMRDDVDSLLKQYLPLEGNANGREHIHTHDKQRLIDEGADI